MVKDVLTFVVEITVLEVVPARVSVLDSVSPCLVMVVAVVDSSNSQE